MVLDYKSNTTANPTQLKECLGRNELSRSELGWICNPAPMNIRICNTKYTVLTFFPASQMLIFNGVGLQIRHNATIDVMGRFA